MKVCCPALEMFPEIPCGGSAVKMKPHAPVWSPFTITASPFLWPEILLLFLRNPTRFYWLTGVCAVYRSIETGGLHAGMPVASLNRRHTAGEE